MKAILYTRVSTSKQAVDGVSLDHQASKLHQYADLHGFDDNELMLKKLRVFTDEALSTCKDV